MSWFLRAAAPLIFVLSTSPAAAQDGAIVEQLAPVLAAEDARDWQPDLFQQALVAPDSQVRRLAALAAGRIGDYRATPLLLPLLDQPDSTVRVAAAFALGLLGDSAALEPLIERLTGLPALDTATAAEAVTAVAKIGGARSGEFFGAVLQGRTTLSQSDPAPAVSQMVLESWRLGPHAPANALLSLASDTNPELRWSALYSLARLRAPSAANHMIAALRAEDPDARAIAARSLNRDYARAAELAPVTVSGALVRALDDQDPGVRVNGLRSLASFKDSSLARQVVSRLEDTDLNVRVQAAVTLGELGGATAAEALYAQAQGKASIALRREALLGLARTAPARFHGVAESWRKRPDWRSRAAAAEGWALSGAAGSPWFVTDRDGRVVAAGLQAWAGRTEGAEAKLLDAARRLVPHDDAAVRSVAADVIARAGDPADLAALITLYRRSLRDSVPDATLSALGALAAISRSGAGAQARVEREFLNVVSRPANYLVRLWAEVNWPGAAARWGPAYPVATGRSLQDYRDIVRRFVLAPDSVSRPHVMVETDQRGVLEIELLGPEAPLTVANFLRLADQRFFDGLSWHRVVPQFVVQTGDPRGDGFGSSGVTIRDEINRVRYQLKPTVGMALSGPDSGSSQWFIAMGRQPHLDGTYPVFGRVVSGQAALARITQGDGIRTIKR